MAQQNISLPLLVPCGIPPYCRSCQYCTPEAYDANLLQESSINASTDRGASSELRDRRQSGAEASTADSSIRSGQNGSAPGPCNGNTSCSDSFKRSREESAEPPALIRLDVTAGPCASQSYTLAEGLTEVPHRP